MWQVLDGMMSNQKFWQKKLWQITPNLPKFFTIKVFFLAVLVTFKVPFAHPKV